MIQFCKDTVSIVDQAVNRSCPQILYPSSSLAQVIPAVSELVLNESSQEYYKFKSLQTIVGYHGATESQKCQYRWFSNIFSHNISRLGTWLVIM